MAEKSGIQAPVQPDAALAAIVGKKPLSRGEILKKLWEYINAEDLKGPNRTIKAGGLLRPLLNGAKSVPSTQLMSIISEHVTKL